MPAHNPPPILITGAGRNVGAHICRRLLAEGRPVVAHYRSATDATDALRRAGADLLQADFAGPEAIAAFADKLLARHPRLSGIVHNASAFAITADAVDDAVAQMQAFYSVHMLAPFMLNRLLAPALQGIGQKPADIVHITDIYAENPAAEYDIYCATKAGLQSLAISAAKRLAPAVKVNVIAPGPINFTEWHAAQHKQEVVAQTLLQRSGSAEAVYRALASILGNDFLTGAVLAVDGGRRWGR